jgi:hypothetical protein
MLDGLSINDSTKVFLIAGVLDADALVTDVYSGSFHKIFMNPSLLGNSNKHNQLDFMLIVNGDTATIRESPDIKLQRIFSYKSQSAMFA